MTYPLSVGASMLYSPPLMTVTGNRSLLPNPKQVISELGKPVLDVVHEIGDVAKKELASPAVMRTLSHQAPTLKTMAHLGRNAGFLSVIVDVAEGVVDIVDIAKDKHLSSDEKRHRIEQRAEDMTVDAVWDLTVGDALMVAGVGMGGIYGGLAAAKLSERGKDSFRGFIKEHSDEFDPNAYASYNKSGPYVEQRFGMCSTSL